MKLVKMHDWCYNYEEDGHCDDIYIEEICETCDGEGGDEEYDPSLAEENGNEDDYVWVTCEDCDGECSEWVTFHEASEKGQKSYLEKMYYRRVARDLILLINNGHIGMIDFSDNEMISLCKENQTITVNNESYKLEKSEEIIWPMS